MYKYLIKVTWGIYMKQNGSLYLIPAFPLFSAAIFGMTLLVLFLSVQLWRFRISISTRLFVTWEQLLYWNSLFCGVENEAWVESVYLTVYFLVTSNVM